MAPGPVADEGNGLKAKAAAAHQSYVNLLDYLTTEVQRITGEPCVSKKQTTQPADAFLDPFLVRVAEVEPERVAHRLAHPERLAGHKGHFLPQGAA